MTNDSKWIFYKGYDSTNHDLYQYQGKTPQELQVLASTNGAVAFNTLGYVKSKVEFPLYKSPYFGPNDGLYVRQEILESIEEEKEYYDLRLG